MYHGYVLRVIYRHIQTLIRFGEYYSEMGKMIIWLAQGQDLLILPRLAQTDDSTTYVCETVPSDTSLNLINGAARAIHSKPFKSGQKLNLTLKID